VSETFHEGSFFATRILRPLGYGLIIVGVGFLCSPYFEFGDWYAPAKEQLKELDVEVIEAHSTSRSAVSGFRDTSGKIYTCYIVRCGDFTANQWSGRKLKIYVSNDKVFQITEAEKHLLTLEDATNYTWQKVRLGSLMLIAGGLIAASGFSSARRNKRATGTFP
jgi:hypothetical protein